MSEIFTRDEAATVTWAVDEWLGLHGVPKVTSLDEETHLFHYSEDWADSPIIFVNKNGNHQRLIKTDAWYAFTTWRSIIPADEWEFKNLHGEDPERVIAKISVGPGAGKKESLCFLPKDAGTQSRRRAVAYRYHLLLFGKVRNQDAFSLYYPENKITSPPMTGRAWESQEAVWWARKELGVDDPPLLRGWQNPYTREREQEVIAASIEEHELYGAWG